MIPYHLIFVFSSMLIVVRPASADTFTEPSAVDGEMYDEADDDNAIDPSDEWTPGDKGDLASTQGERRNEADQAILLELGEASAWNSLGVRWVKFHEKSLAVSVQVGLGRIRQNIIMESLELDTQTTSAGSRVQWWPSDLFPFSLAGDIGIHRWNVNATCMFAEASGTCRGGRFSALGFSGSAGLVVSWLSEKNWIFQWTVLSFKRSQTLTQTWSGDAGTSSEGSAKKSIVGQKMYGFANFSCGWLF